MGWSPVLTGNEAEGEMQCTEQAAPVHGCSRQLQELHRGPWWLSSPEAQNDDKLERIQKRATEVINGQDGLIYEERLKGLIVCIAVTE